MKLSTGGHHVRSGRTNPVAVIGYGLWRQRFAADAKIINKTITLNDRPFTVIGVLPPEFQFYRAADVFVSINLTLPERLPDIEAGICV